MSANAWVSLVGLLGALVLAGSGLRGRQLGAGKTMLMATAWGVIFLAAMAIIAAVSGE